MLLEECRTKVQIQTYAVFDMQQLYLCIVYIVPAGWNRRKEVNIKTFPHNKVGTLTI